MLADKTYAFGAAALSVTGGSATVDDTLVVLDQTGNGDGDGVRVTPAEGETLDLALRSVTVTGTGSDRRHHATALDRRGGALLQRCGGERLAA